MKHVALFAGIGGFMFAARQAGMETVWANEVDRKCCDVLELNFPETKVSQKSIADLDKSDMGEVDGDIDLLTAGFPCQSFSIAGGEIKAFDDPRGKLFFEICITPSDQPNVHEHSLLLQQECSSFALRTRHEASRQPRESPCPRTICGSR